MDFEIGRDHGAARADGDRPRRAHERRRGRARRADAGGGRRARARVAEGARPAREARELPALRRHVRALPLADRAAHLAAVVVRDGGAAQAGARGAARAARPLPPASRSTVRDPLARGDPRLERLAPALVGAPAAALVLPGRPRHLRVAAAGRVRRVRLAPTIERDPDVLDTWFSSALWPFATLGWPEQTRGAPPLLPGRRQLDRARDHPPLGEPDDLDGPRADGGGAVHRRDHPLDDPRRRRPPHVEEPRHGRRPARRDRQARRRRDPLRPAEDVLDAGRPLRRGDDRGGPEAREQALERRRGCCSRSGSSRTRGRATLEERWILARLDATRAEVEEAWSRFEFSPSVQALYHLTFDDFCDWYAEAIKPRLAARRGPCARPRSRRSSGC